MLNSPLELLPSTFYVLDPFPKVKRSLQLQGIHDLVGTDEQIGTHGAPSSWVCWEPEVMPVAQPGQGAAQGTFLRRGCLSGVFRDLME